MPLDERGGKQTSRGYLQSPSKIHQQQKTLAAQHALGKPIC